MVDFLYTTVVGRFLLKILLHTRLLKVMEWFVHRPLSKVLIDPFIKRNQIDMSEFAEQNFASYADFFARKKDIGEVDQSPETFISPCDCLLSMYRLDEDTTLHVKNHYYKINELIPDKEIADSFRDGTALIFRLRASDYHHYCYVDDCYQNETHFIPGMLHSVQPIALEKEPVFQVNRRLWSVLDTKNFGRIAQIEVGAVLVGGMVHEVENGNVKRGDEMGHFELIGSTIIMLLQADTAKHLTFLEKIETSAKDGTEVEVKIGQKIATR